MIEFNAQTEPDEKHASKKKFIGELKKCDVKLPINMDKNTPTQKLVHIIQVISLPKKVDCFITQFLKFSKIDP